MAIKKLSTLLKMREKEGKEVFLYKLVRCREDQFYNKYKNIVGMNSDTIITLHIGYFSKLN